MVVGRYYDWITLSYRRQHVSLASRGNNSKIYNYRTWFSILKIEIDCKSEVNFTLKKSKDDSLCEWSLVASEAPRIYVTRVQIKNPLLRSCLYLKLLCTILSLDNIFIHSYLIGPFASHCSIRSKRTWEKLEHISTPNTWCIMDINYTIKSKKIW